MTKKKEIFLVLDGNALLHRAWHAIPPLTTQDGTVVNAAYGFTMILEKMLEAYQPTFMAVAWDLKGKTFRHEEYADYKAHRAEKEQELYDQIPIIQDILVAYGIPSLSAKGFEADDVIGTLAKKASLKEMKTYIVTGDLDALQLVNESVSVVTFKKGISEIKEYDRNAVKERYGLSPEQLIDYKALRGDPSDNIPGVAGIGEKTATTLVQDFGSIKEIYTALEQGKIEAKFAKKLEDQKKVAEDSKRLVTIVQDVPLSFRFSSEKMSAPNEKVLKQLFQKLEFRSLLRKHTVVPPPPSETMQALEKETKKQGIVIVRASTLKEECENLSLEKIGIFIATQAADLFGATLAAVGLSDGIYTIILPNPSKEQLFAIQTFLKKAKLIITHDLKQLFHVTDWEIESKCFDLQIGSYLLHAGSRAHELDEVVKKYFPHQSSDVPQGFATEKDYLRLGKMISLFPQIADSMLMELTKLEMQKVVWDIEMPLVKILFEMEQVGIELDVKALGIFSKKLKTQSGYSTAAPELEKLWEEHKIIPLISEYRELAKLQSTYAESLPKLVEKDGRIHTSYNQTVTSTGRLSSSDPNLQNITIRTDLGNEIRKAFVSGRGKKLLSADYSQIELRIVSVIAKDKPFISAFLDGADIHRRTASEVWETPEEEVTSEQRRAAKAINFGILYGMGPRALARSTNMSMAEAKRFIERYFEIHHAIKEYLDETKIQAHERGYVESLFGRRRYLPEIHSGVQQLVATAERMAINMPVQGTSADVMKKAMIATEGWLKKSGWPAKMLLQVHDELVFEVVNDAVDQVARGVKEMMEGVANFDIPLVVDVEIGNNW